MNECSSTEKSPSGEQRLTMNDSFQARSPYLFETNEQSSRIEVYGQLPVHQNPPLKANSFNDDQKINSQVNTDPSSVLPSPLDQSSYSAGDLPLYSGKPTWRWQNIGDEVLLKAIAEV